MKKTAIAIGLITIIIIFGVIIGYFWANSPASKPDIGDKHPSMVLAIFSPSELTVAQGATFQVNLTLTSFLDTEVLIPLENLSVETYRFPNTHVPQEAYNYTFSLNSLILAPSVPNSSILTLKLAEDFPIGDWKIVVTFGNSQLTYLSGKYFSVTVTSR